MYLTTPTVKEYTVLLIVDLKISTGMTNYLTNVMNSRW